MKSSLLSSPHLHVVWSNVGEVKERSYVIDVPADSLAPPKPAGGDDCVKLKRKMEKTGEGRQSSESTRSTASDLMVQGRQKRVCAQSAGKTTANAVRVVQKRKVPPSHLHSVNAIMLISILWI